MSRIKLNNVDLAWLRMDRPVNPMMITVVLQFSEPLIYDRLIANLKHSLSRYRRFRQRIVRPAGFFSRPYWEDDPNYRVEDHVQRLLLPLPADDTALQELVSRKMSVALNFARPLWEVTLVENYSQGSALIIRVHHCIADGISLMQVLMLMTHTSPDQPTVPGTEPQAFDLSQAPPASSSAEPVDPPPNLFRNTLYEKHTFTEIMAAIVRIVFRSPDPLTILKGPLGKVKKAVWSEPLNLPDIRIIARSKQATSNDVLMAAASGAIRRYLDLHHNNPKRNIRAFILVNLRRRFFDEELGNKFGLVFLDLPLNYEQPLERLDQIKQGMDSLKASAEYAATFQILNLLGQVPEWAEHLATMLLDTKGTVVATNVAGPRRQLYLAGVPIQSIIAWVPQSGRIGVGVSFITYNNQVWAGINSDVGVIPDPEKLLELFIEELNSFQPLLSAASPPSASPEHSVR